MSDLTAEDVAWLKALRPTLDSALRLHDSTTDHHPDAVEILRAMNAAGRDEEEFERGGYIAPATRHWVDTPTPARDVTVEVRAPRWHKGEDAPDWLVPGATVRVLGCDGNTAHHGLVDAFIAFEEDGSADVGSCRYAAVLELVAPAPEPAVDWEARAKAAEDRVARALDVHDKWHYDVATCRRGYSNAAVCRAADILRGES